MPSLTASPTPEGQERNESPDAPAAVVVTSPAESSRFQTPAIAAMHAELDAIVVRQTDAPGCRVALLDCVVRHRTLIGGLWYRVEKDQAVPDVRRLSGAVFDRNDVHKWLGAAASRCAAERRPLVMKSTRVRNLTAICAPAPAREELAAPADAASPLVLCLLCADSTSKSEEAEQLAAECVVRAWSSWLDWRAARTSIERLDSTAALMELLTRLTAATSVIESCQTAVNELQGLLGCQFVAVGLCKSSQSAARFAAVSGLGDVDPHAPVIGRLESAINEGLLRERMTTYPSLAKNSEGQDVAHRRVIETLGVEAVVTVPIGDLSGRAIGGLVCGGAARRLLASRTIDFLKASAAPLGTALDAVRRSEGGLVRRAERKLAAAVKSRRGAFAAGAAALVVGTLFLPVSYRIRCRAQAEPIQRRYCLAPYDGLVEHTLAAPGDLVTAGQLVAKMDGRELGWELAGVSAEAEQKAKQRDIHLSSQAVADSILSALEMEQLAARRLLLGHRLDNLDLRSPIDGVVIGGSVDQRRNYPVTKGQVLYEIAPLHPLRIEIAVPAAELPHVRTGMRADIQINGETGLTRTGIIAKIRPRSEIRQNLNVFIAEVEVDNGDHQLRPGMEGGARIVGDRHALGWNLGHRLWERLVTACWW